MPFERSGLYLGGLVVIAVAGFWPSYFSKFFDGTADYNSYFHLHALTALLWIALLIAQPILIHRRRLVLHKRLGAFSYVLFPAVLLTVILLAHSQSGTKANVAGALFLPFKDLLILCVAYGIGIYHRRRIEIHSRAMIATGIVFIEPSLVRFIFNILPPNSEINGYALTVGLIYAIIFTLIFLERRKKKGRWVFPLILGLYVAVHGIILGNIRIGVWEKAAHWFVGLPLT